MKPLIVDPRFLRPLPKALFNSACKHCDRLQSMWEMGPEGGDCSFVCSLCFLYESKWGEDRVDEIHEMVAAVEKEASESWFRDQDGKTLINVRDANRVLGAIALTSRMFLIRDRMEVLADPEPKPADGEPAAAGLLADGGEVSKH